MKRRHAPKLAVLAGAALALTLAACSSAGTSSPGSAVTATAQSKGVVTTGPGGATTYITPASAGSNRRVMGRIPATTPVTVSCVLQASASGNPTALVLYRITSDPWSGQYVTVNSFSGKAAVKSC